MALQHLHSATKRANLFPSNPTEEELAKAKAEIHIVKSVRPLEDAYLLALFGYQYSITNPIASAINLTLSEDSTKHLIFYNRENTSNAPVFHYQFNNLGNGSYTIFLDTDEGNHSIVYLKKDFGSYLIDPNYGLIKCPADNPASELVKQMNHYKSDQLAQSATIFGYI